MPLTNDIVDEKLKPKNIKRLEDYVNNHTKILFKCLICNHEWRTCTKVLFNVGCGCPCCNASGINEKTIRDIFEQNKLNFIYQHPIKRNSKYNTKPYRFDFYFPDIATVLEYNGAQHYRPVKFGGMSQEDAEANFIKQQKRDEYMKQYCVDNKLKLIEIDGSKLIDNKLIKYIVNDIIPLIKTKKEQNAS